MELTGLIMPYAPASKRGVHPFSLPQCFASISCNSGLAFQMLATVNAKLIERGLLLKAGTVVDATLIAAPSSTKNNSGERDPEMHQTKKGNQWHFGMKAHIGADAESGLVHTVTGTAANEHDITQAHALLHGEEAVVFADSGYRGITKRQEIQAQHPGVGWQVAMMPGKRRALKKSKTVDALIDKLEKIKARIRAKVNPPRVIKCQFSYRKTRYRCLAKNTAQLITLFALSNLRMVRKRNQAEISRNCRGNYESIYQWAVADHSVVLVSRWAERMGATKGFGSVDGNLSFVLYSYLENRNEIKNNSEAFVKAFRHKVNSLQSNGERLVFVHQMLAFIFYTSFCVSCPFPLNGLQEDDNDRCFINRGFVETRQHKYRQIFDLVNVDFPDLLIVDPMPVF